MLVAYVAAGFLACETAFFTGCHPFSGYWAVPPPNRIPPPLPPISCVVWLLTGETAQCTTFVHYAIVNAVFNISSDIAMILIPLPLLVNSRLPVRQKAAVCSVFCMVVAPSLARLNGGANRRNGRGERASS